MYVSVDKKCYFLHGQLNLNVCAYLRSSPIRSMVLIRGAQDDSTYYYINVIRTIVRQNLLSSLHFSATSIFPSRAAKGLFIVALSSSLDNANRVSALAGKSSGLQRIIFVFNMLLVSILLLLLPPQALPCLNVPPHFADDFFWPARYERTRG